MKINRESENLRNFVFGVEDSLVSTIGLVSGIAAAGVPRLTIIITGMILVLVEALSMSTGTILSENSVEELKSHHDVPMAKSIGGAFVMFFSYLFSGLLILSPYVLLEPNQAFGLSIAVSVIALFFLGVFSAYVARTHMIRKGIIMIVLGGVTIAVSVTVGAFLRVFV